MPGQNPYSLIFGKEPVQIISRIAQQMDIIESFDNEPATQQIYMITGVRGCGKTVFMTEISKELKTRREWIVVELNSSSNMLEDFAAALASDDNFALIFKEASINLSLFGIGLEVEGSVPISNIQTALIRMLESLKAHGKKVLICIDEVTVTDYMKVFSGAFQILIRADLPVFLLMTGLYENINNLQNEKNLTFLYRAPKVEIKPLNLNRIADNYVTNFELDEGDANIMARITRGYSFAFQVLGFFTWKNGGDYKEAMPEFRQYLEDYVYDKIWGEMSLKDRDFAYGIAKTKSGKAKDIRDFLSMKDNEYSPYRSRLIKSGILDGSTHGVVRFLLPLFEDYVISKIEMQV